MGTLTGRSSSFSPSMENLNDMNNVKACIPIILDVDSLNYEAWRELFWSYCVGFGVIDHIEDSNSSAVSAAKLVDPEWNRIDSIVKLWIYATISQSLFQTILKTRNLTAKQVWMNLWTVIHEKCAIRFNNELSTIVSGSYSSITDYCTRIKTVADYLAYIGHHVPEDKLVVYTINGLSPKFAYVVGIIRQRSPLPSFSETWSLLLQEESVISQINLLLKHILMRPDLFFKTKIVRALKATLDFQVLGERYQVVSDLEKGEASDKNEKSGVPDFGVLFDSDYFEDYIGQLSMAAILQEEGHFTKERMTEFQRERETKLITILKNRLQPFVKGQTTEFVDWATSEACQLSQTHFGEAMLHTISYIYTRQAARELGKYQLYMLPFLTECVWNIGHQMKSQFLAFSGEVKLIDIQEELKKLDNSEGKEEQIMKVVEEKNDQMIKSLWQINVLDIETTLSRVCQAVLKDPTVSKDELKQRAIGMEKLGVILLGAKKQEGAQVQFPSASK